MQPERARQLLSAERVRIARGLAHLALTDEADPDDGVDSAANLAAELYQEELDEGLADDLRHQLAAVQRAAERTVDEETRPATA